MTLPTPRPETATTSATSVQPKPPETKVKIRINNAPYEIEPGLHAVAELKRLAGINDCDELAQVEDKRPVPLPSAGSVKIKGHEEFLSSPGSCSSS